MTMTSESNIDLSFEDDIINILPSTPEDSQDKITENVKTQTPQEKTPEEKTPEEQNPEEKTPEEQNPEEQNPDTFNFTGFILEEKNRKIEKNKKNRCRKSDIYLMIHDGETKGYFNSMNKVNRYIKREADTVLEKYSKDYPGWNVHVDRDNLSVKISVSYSFFMIIHTQTISEISCFKIKKLAT